MSDYFYVSGHRDKGTKIKSYKAESRVLSTIVTVQIEVTDADELSWLLSQLHEAKHPRKPAPKPRKEPKALPSPTLRLPDLRGGGQ